MASKPIPQIRKAEKRRVKLKLGIQGPSGSGKTWGALSLVKNLWPNAKVCLIDTENESASLYADHFEFDTIPLDPPFETERYQQAIDAAVRSGHDVLIIDTISHQWDGEGGILERKAELDQRPGANSYTNWNMFTPEHRSFIESIKQAPIHILATMRAKQDYILETNDKGKSKPVKVGMAPVQRDGFDYEFSLVFDVQMDHRATLSKNRTGLFEKKVINLADPKVADELRGWLESGKEPEPLPAQPQIVPPVSQPEPPALPKPNGNASSHPAAAHKVEGWKLEKDQLSCYVYDVQQRTSKKGKTYYAVKHNGKVNNKDMAFCWHENMFKALEVSKDRKATFLLEIQGDFVNIIDVVEVEGQEFRDGRPYQPEPQIPLPEQPPFEGATDDDIPF